MNRSRRVVAIAAVLIGCARLAHGAPEYPLTLTLDARVDTAGASLTSRVTIVVERLMEPSRKTRVLDALKYGGYPSFLTTLRALPPIGSIGVAKRQVEVRYADEEVRPQGRRLVFVADRPLFFLGEAAKSRAGYELTMVELIVDDKGQVTGTMTGAARVKPNPAGGLVLDNYAEAPVQLTGRITTPN